MTERFSITDIMEKFIDQKRTKSKLYFKVNKNTIVTKEKQRKLREEEKKEDLSLQNHEVQLDSQYKRSS